MLVIGGLFALASFASAEPSADVACNPYDGWELLREKSSTHVVMFGEMHGTNESPEAVRGLVCELVKSGLPVKLGVEANADQGAALNQVFSGEAGRDEIFAAAPKMWATPDGRSSEAVLGLLKEIAAWRNAGADIEIFAFDWGSAQQDMARWKSMAANVDQAAAGFDGAMILYTGGYHTTLNPPAREGKGGSLASGVTTRPAFPVQMMYDGGEAYVTYSVSGSELTTGVLSLSERGYPPETVRTITLDPDDPRQALYFTGPITASPPAFPDAAN